MHVWEAIRAEHGAIVERWTAAVSETHPHLSVPLLVDGIPDLLLRLAAWLERLRPGDARAFDGSVGAHAVERLQAGCDLDQIVVEYSILREVTLERIAPHVDAGALADLRRLNRAIDAAISDAVVRFTEERQRALAQSEAQLQAIIDNAPAIIFVRDYRRGDGVYVLVNRHLEETFGQPRGRILGRTVDEILPGRDPDEVAELRAHDRDVMARGEAARFLERLTIDERTSIWTSLKFPMRDTHDETFGVCCIAVDVTEREREAQARDRFISILAHDLRGPLQTISIGATFLREASSPHDAATNVERIARAGVRMERMVNDVLDFARGRFGHGISVARHPADLAQITRGVVDELHACHPARDLRVACSGDTLGFWDEQRVAQALTNIIGNALTHGQDPVTITVRGDVDAVQVIVTNAGPPIDPDLLPVLFEPFRRADTSKGLGLGLYIAREIVCAHGGWIEVESAPGETRVHTEWPRKGSLPASQPTDHEEFRNRPTQRLRRL